LQDDFQWIFSELVVSAFGAIIGIDHGVFGWELIEDTLEVLGFDEDNWVVVPTSCSCSWAVFCDPEYVLRFYGPVGFFVDEIWVVYVLGVKPVDDH
jgi:hypothetical protein